MSGLRLLLMVVVLDSSRLTPLVENSVARRRLAAYFLDNSVVKVGAALDCPENFKEGLCAHGPRNVTAKDLLGRDAALIVKDGVGVGAADNDGAVDLDASPETTALHVAPHGPDRLGEGGVDTGTGADGAYGDGGITTEGYARVGKGIDLGWGVEHANAVVNVEAEHEAGADGGNDKG